MKTLITLILLITVRILIASPLDSIGVEKKNGKTYILHQVDIKESLYSISRKYGVKVDEIRAANPDLKTDELKVGQTILIPSKTAISSTSSKSNEAEKVHIVKKGESYYKIAQRYGVDIEKLKKANNNKEVKTGDKMIIPGTSSSSKSTSTSEDPKNTNESGNYKIHTVEAKETLFGISKKYGVEVDAIKKANPEIAEGLKSGMEIKIPSKNGPGENKKETAKKTTKKDIEKPVKKTETKETVTNREVVTDPPKKEPEKTESTIQETNRSSETVKSKGGFDEIEEKGMAELMESKEDAPKFQALHRTATVGTIIQVINSENGQKIFVRVIGKLDGGNSNTIIKLSQRAMERLQAKESKISVQLSYIP